MDSAADGLLALSNTVAAIAVDNSLPNDDDDRSSSLTELEDAEDEEEEIVQVNNAMDGDSEAETERLEESPDKSKRAFQLSPSKLAQSVNVADERPEIEELTNSEASSPITPIEESPLQSELSEAEDMPNPLDILSQAAAATNKRKRLSDVMDMTEDLRPRKRRTESVDSEDEKSDVESELPEVPSREPTVEADDPEVQAESEKDDGPEQEQTELSDGSKSKKPEQYTRSRSRRGKDPAEPEVQDEEDNEAVEASDEDVEADDVETTAKNEEEQLKRAAAMEALTALERHFATLRDKLYDEKIAQLNHELDQLTEVESTHPELLKQFECVNKYRDEKQDTEQKLLVFKVGALKRKSLAERSQIHSAYFQTVRDVRERHMERMSEHFYRIQRERFKSSQVTPTYTIPFPEKRIQQVTQQTAYNREVSILSGVAKYVGFPAAPELPSVQASDLEGDMQKMGINSSSIRSHTTHARTSHRSLNTYPTTSLTAPTAAASAAAAAAAAASVNTTSEQQFLEQTPWANPNHPVHRLGRRNASRSPLPDGTSSTYGTSTPANQQKRADYTPQAIGSASTIVENPSAQPTSAFNTPHDSAVKQEPQLNGLPTTNGFGSANISRNNSVSPTETRRTINSMLQAGNAAAAQSSEYHQPMTTAGDSTLFAGVNSSPLQARAALLTGLNRTASVQPADRENTRSPFRQGLVSGGGMGRFGFR
ncbi:hypothetical protein H2198_004288 [Neophaeococcomyces mojaviensis]|uniref:Uncharacterized protein n=1 Tax=Neophaeococcomyces mojaviensis TaxID=3383035 RepID=A0ACC3A934_9EURO|nr:hypothetical protein H2198_004288 [Knufia sp. JES_112]